MCNKFSKYLTKCPGRFALFCSAIVAIGLLSSGPVQSQELPSYPPSIEVRLFPWTGTCSGNYQPRQGNGLTATVSCSTDGSGTREDGSFYQVTVDGAAYAGGGVEPMTDVEVDVTNTGNFNAKALLTWPYKVEGGSWFDDPNFMPWVDVIPIIITWRVSQSATGETASARTLLCEKSDATMIYSDCAQGAYTAEYVSHIDE